MHTQCKKTMALSAGLVWLGAAMSLCVHGFAYADYEKGLRAYVEQDYKNAVEEWSAPELARNPEALFALGVMYMRGEGITQDQRLGAEYYEKSAAMGFRSAQYNLGLAYFSGKGVVQNFEKSRHWWLQAAMQDHPLAQYNLGAILWSGNGVPQDQARAMHWFRKAKANGSRDASDFLLTLFAPMYHELSAENLELASASKERNIPLIDQFGMYKLGLQAIEKQEYAQAFGYWEPLARDGHLDSQYQIARLYEQGRGVEKDFGAALDWYERAAQKGQGDAQYRIGLYHMNESPDKNEALGFYWIQSAADNNSAEAKAYIENM